MSEESKAGAVTSFQTFTTETIHRSKLKNASYNPRHLTLRGRQKLKDSLKRVGLVQPIVWNKRSGNIVGGHQRISQIDALEKSGNYSLTVAVVDVDEARERELNVLLNNTEVGGDWDFEKLKELLNDPLVELENTGFDSAEMMKMFGKSVGMPESAHQQEVAEQLKGVKEAYEKLSQMNRNKDDRDFYCVVVFGSYNERKEFADALGLEEDNRYIDGRLMTRLLLEKKEAQPSTTGNEGDANGVG